VEIKGFLIFISVFLALYLGLNSYVVLRLGRLLNIKNQILYIFTLLITVSLPLAVYLERVYPNILFKLFYTLSTLWLGILLFLLFLLLIYEIVNIFYTPPYGGEIILGIALILSIISILNAKSVVIKEIEISLPNLEKDITLVQLSDLHIGTIRNSKFLNNIVEKTNNLNPDVVLITGDMIDGASRLDTKIAEELEKIKAPIYFVTGNHEVIEGIEKVYSFLQKTKVNILKDEITSFDNIQIIGIEYKNKKEEVQKVLQKIKIDDSKPRILLYHDPKAFEGIENEKINLALFGHTHNGQIFPFSLLVKAFYKYPQGLYKVGDNSFVYVSPGSGTWGPYMRLGSKNEITLFKLKSKNKE
jgi:predicted MPP superfamily phosphohydrolase